MKTRKNIFALFLALAMAFSTLVVPAMAAGSDEIMGSAGYECLVCGGACRRSGNEYSYRRDESYRVSAFSNNCKNHIAEAHTHKPYDIMEVYTCENCGHKDYRKIGESYDCIRDSING